MKKDTLIPKPERWKHMRPFMKRKISKKERQAAKKQIKDVDSPSDD